MAHENMNIKDCIKQLESLKRDRLSFVVGDKEHDEVYLKDADAIEIVLGNLDALCDMQRTADRELKNARQINEEHKNQIKELDKTNNDLRLLYRRTANKLSESGKEELAGYFLAQINEVPTFTIDDDIDYYEEYYKLKEKVKELESDLYSTNCIVKELTEENIKLKVLEDDIKDKRITYIDTPEFEENYIPKQKIKDKIKELNKQEQQLQNSISKEEREEYSDANISFQLCDIEIRKEVLKEILQESEDK